MNGKSQEHHRLLERDEAACVTADDVGVCGVFPVVEAEDTMLLGSSAPEEDERKHQESDQEDECGPGEPKSRFSVGADRHGIQINDHDEHDGDPDSDVDVVRPVADD
jgi:hypothetical protein